MTLSMLLGIIGGLGIFLFGMFYMNDALQKVSGRRFRDILIKLTSSPLRGAGTGFVVTLFNQSSSATTLLEVSLVSAGIITFGQTMAITMGAEIGSTITAQLVAFNMADYAVFIAGLGFYLSFFSSSRRLKYTGNALFGFGLLFLGMKIMADLMVPMRNNIHFIAFMGATESPLAGILIGMGFTMLIHSSGATAGIVIALALAGAISLQQAIPLNLGAQVGTCVTALLGAIGRGREGKRVAYWHVFHQAAGVILIYPFLTFVRIGGDPAWIYFVRLVTETIFGTVDVARQIAMAHTYAAVCNTLIFFPFLPLMRRLMLRLFPAHEEDKPFGPVFIDDGLLGTPSLALEQARREILREGEIVQEMFRDSLRVFTTKDVRLADTVSLKDIRVDVLRNSLVPYLARIAQNNALQDDQSRLETQLLFVVADIEAIGDVIDKNIMPLARKKLENNLWFSDEGWRDIVDLHARVTENLERAIEALRSGNQEFARRVLDSKAEINTYESELRKRHIVRLHSGLQESLETSSVHLDLIDQFKRINSHIAAVGQTLLGEL